MKDEAMVEEKEIRLEERERRAAAAHGIAFPAERRTGGGRIW
jgi:hypothetical protein